MRIDFEKWMDNNSIPENAKDLFGESVVCYKISAYRSAFIMSYIAFQNILRDRILTASYLPTGINTNLWSQICRDLGNEDVWDSKISECVKRQSPDKVFLISDAIVKEYEALRTIRNKCAHGKNGKIEYFHVELLWHFIKENYYRFMINGGKSGIMQIIEKHYDRTITPVGQDVTYIIDNIKSGVLDDELFAFIGEFYQYCEQENSTWACGFTARDRMIDLWDKLVNESDERIHNAVINFIIQNKSDIVCEFVARYPSTADEFLGNDAFARKLWTGYINQCGYDETGKWIILEKLIRGTYIPEDEREDFEKVLFKAVTWLFPKDKVEILKETAYFNKLINVLLDSTQYGYPNGIVFANCHDFHFIHYIEVFGIDAKVVSCINQIFSFATFGSFYDRIRSFMKKNPAALNQYKEVCSEKNITDYSDKMISEED